MSLLCGRGDVAPPSPVLWRSGPAPPVRPSRGGRRRRRSSRLAKGHAELLEEHRERYPAFMAVIADGTRMSHDNGREFGLQRILGIEVLVKQRAGRD